MQRWLQDVFARIRDLASNHEVLFTHKALRELAALDLGLDEDDRCCILAGLTATDSAGRIRSVITGEWMYVFKPTVTRTRIYLKLILRRNCIIISFHEEGDENGN
jgi:hypothetical protein